MNTPLATSSLAADRDAYYGRIEVEHLAPLWTRLKSLVPTGPAVVGQPHRWRYEDVRPYVFESGKLISAAEAERRVLILESPAFRGESRITTSLYAGLQLLLPGEVAPAHRHTQSALRLVLEGGGAYTAVDGEKTIMREGDFVITPSWTWHHHGNESDEPIVWLDGLDIPTVAFFNSTFREDHREGAEAAITRPIGDALARYGSGLLPVGHRPGNLNSPVFNYPYERTREALRAMAHAGSPDPRHGYLMRFANPVDGGWAMPTIATMIRLLPAGFSTLPYQSSDACVFVALEGRGAITIGDARLDFGPRDVITVPGWLAYTVEANSDAVLFSFSDRVAQEKLGFFRESSG